MFLSNTKTIIFILIVFALIVFTILVLIKILHKKCKPITTCIENGNCGDGSDGCTGKCNCPDKQTCDGNKCIPFKSSITTCIADGNCGEGSDGSTGKCKCPGKQICDGKNCIPCKPSITTCIDNNCSEGSDGCTGKCKCPDKQTCNGNKCIPCKPSITTCIDDNCGDGSDGCTGNCNCLDGYTCMSDKCTEINFIAVGSGENNFAYSNDGIKWISGNTQVFSTNAYGIINIPSSNTWLAFGQGGHNSTGEVQSNIFRTYDGKKWNPTQNNFLYAKGGAYYNTVCVAVGKISNPYGKSSILSRSDDMGTSWLDTTDNVQTIGNAIAFNKNLKMWIVVGSDANNNFSYSYSNGTDPSQYAIKWFPGKIDIGEINGIATNNLSNSNLWVAIGNKGTAYSSNGVKWTVLNNILFSNPKAITCNGSLWVAVGSDSKSGKCIAYSSDGIIWTYVKANIFSNGAQGITWHDKKFLWVAVGSDNSGNTIAYSTNGKDWTMVESKFFDKGGYGVASKNN